MRLEAEALQKQQKMDEAIRLYSNIERDGLAEPADLLALAQAYRAQRNMQGAYNTLERLLQISPYHQQAVAEMVKVANDLGKKEVVALNRERLEWLSVELSCKK
jgi:tetratricopeptide (TPR) repeat protein